MWVWVVVSLTQYYLCLQICYSEYFSKTNSTSLCFLLQSLLKTLIWRSHRRNPYSPVWRRIYAHKILLSLHNLLDCLGDNGLISRSQDVAQVLVPGQSLETPKKILKVSQNILTQWLPRMFERQWWMERYFCKDWGSQLLNLRLSRSGLFNPVWKEHSHWMNRRMLWWESC